MSVDLPLEGIAKGVAVAVCEEDSQAMSQVAQDDPENPERVCLMDGIFLHKGGRKISVVSIVSGSRFTRVMVSAARKGKVKVEVPLCGYGTSLSDILSEDPSKVLLAFGEDFGEGGALLGPGIVKVRQAYRKFLDLSDKVEKKQEEDRLGREAATRSLGASGFVTGIRPDGVWMCAENQEGCDLKLIPVVGEGLERPNPIDLVRGIRPPAYVMAGVTDEGGLLVEVVLDKSVVDRFGEVLRAVIGACKVEGVQSGVD
jgi:hypothetical protein